MRKATEMLLGSAYKNSVYYTGFPVTPLSYISENHLFQICAISWE